VDGFYIREALVSVLLLVLLGASAVFGLEWCLQ
jgi:hypothetical protein